MTWMTFSDRGFARRKKPLSKAEWNKNKSRARLERNKRKIIEKRMINDPGKQGKSNYEIENT
jgi:hypothetical protein